ncbi:MAG: TetR/AcrR family transcriptional regulator [Erysipelotrichaceae bacterium]|nr:TetR/AcrR family transcriptional regulator [Erysipelotrichaceae bacterium]
MSESTNLKKKAGTKLKIIDSFIRLLGTKRFDKITVRELCEEAEIVRSTFYTHYQSVYDLIEEMENDLLDELAYFISEEDLANSHALRYTGPERHETIFSVPLDSTFRFFQAIDRNKKSLIALLSENGDPYFEIRLKKQLERDINLMMDTEGIPNDMLRPYFSEVMVSLQLNLLKYWIQAENRADIEYICQISNVIRAGSIFINFSKPE